MPQFAPGESKTAVAPITMKPAGLSCEAEIFLGPDDMTKVATSGRIPFTSTGASQDIHLPIAMPSTEGTYHVFIDVYAEGYLIAAYQAIEDVVITALPPPGEGIIWGRVTDGLTGEAVPDVKITLDGLVHYTESAGQYEFRDLDYRQYQIEFSKEGYVTVTRAVVATVEMTELNISLPPIVPTKPELIYAIPAEAQVISGGTGHINYKVGIPDITAGYTLIFLFGLEGIYWWTPFACANVDFREGARAGYYEGSAGWYAQYMYAAPYKFANVPPGVYRLLSTCELYLDGTLVKTYWSKVDTGQTITVV